MQQYNVILKNDKLKQYDRMALFIILLNITLFAVIAFYSPEKAVRMTSTAGIILLGICLAIDYFLQRIKNNEDTPYKMAGLFIISLAWLNMGFWWVAGLSILITILYQLAKRTLLVNINTNNITYPSLPPKKIDWVNVNTLILKDGLLTISLKDDKLFQQLIDETKTKLDEKEFNDFCSQQLQATAVAN